MQHEARVTFEGHVTNLAGGVSVAHHRYTG